MPLLCRKPFTSILKSKPPFVFFLPPSPVPPSLCFALQLFSLLSPANKSSPLSSSSSVSFVIGGRFYELLAAESAILVADLEKFRFEVISRVLIFFFSRVCVWYGVAVYQPQSDASSPSPVVYDGLPLEGVPSSAV